jgi:hypothetical protein
MKIILTVLFIASALGGVAQNSVKIKMDELPMSSHAQIHGKYAKYHINGMYRKTDAKGDVSYKVELQKKRNVVYLVFNPDGELIDKRKTKEYSFDGSEKPSRPAGSGNGGHSGHNHNH